MHITHLSLTNFRNYGRLELKVPRGATLLYGNNAQGKTNLLEAIYYLATTRSPNADYDYQLINWEASQTDETIVVGRIIAQISTASGEQLLEMRLIREQKAGINSNGFSFRRQALINKRNVRLMDLLGNLRVVMFLPQDIQLVTGSPSVRRRYLDITLCQIDPIYCRALSHYNKVLEQRNALLRQLSEGSGSRDTLPIFTDRLVELGSQVFARRGLFLKNLGREAQRVHYESLTMGQELIRITYLPRLSPQSSARNGKMDTLLELGEWLQEDTIEIGAVQNRFREMIQNVEAMDIARGTTSIGPHRDDWRFWVNNRELNSYGSRGQQRSAILALKMAEINWMTQMTNESPILLLDEVVAELDEQRRASLLSTVKESTQALLTATDPGMFTQSFLNEATNMRVENGRIHASQENEI
ncbi:MAG: DNA replication/repair protein RecF [Chloroflexi bacterium]|nr:MAG: DNA replication/repair protein RecF [Chloroflexota bacterium]